MRFFFVSLDLLLPNFFWSHVFFTRAISPNISLPFFLPLLTTPVQEERVVSGRGLASIFEFLVQHPSHAADVNPKVVAAFQAAGDLQVLRKIRVQQFHLEERRQKCPQTLLEC